MNKWLFRLVALMLCALFFAGCAPAAPIPGPSDQEHIPPISDGENSPPDNTPDTPVLSSPDPTLKNPKADSFTLSFAGDCTFGDNFDAEGAGGGFRSAVKDNYDYPFSNVKSYFENDDCTFVNLECALTDNDPSEEEMEELKEHRFRFRGPASYAKILAAGGVEFASCANNHSKDYGRQGLYDTWDALEAENIAYSSFGKPCLITTKSGLKIGVYSVFFGFGQTELKNVIARLKDQGAELIVMSIHWGDEGSYYPNDTQQRLGRTAIDLGVDIVFGHHSHTLQRIEPYNGGIIYYSLGNFSFGGNRNPSDKDTAILRQQILRYEDGSVRLGDLEIIPCRVSSKTGWNDFRPTPYDPSDEAYARVLVKLEGSFEGNNLNVSYAPLPEKDPESE